MSSDALNEEIDDSAVEGFAPPDGDESEPLDGWPVLGADYPPLDLESASLVIVDQFLG